MPELARPLWLLFLDLHGGRSYGGMGTPQGLSYAEMDAFARVRRRPWQRYEIDAIRAVDRAYLAATSERAAPETPSAGIDALRAPPPGRTAS